MIKRYARIILVFIMACCVACRDDANLLEEDSETKDTNDLVDYSDWTEATHSNLADPNYQVVFNQNEVLRFDIKISSENWSKMQSDLAANMSSGTGGAGGVPGGAPGGPATDDFVPVWVPCSFNFNNIQWYNVGIRYKGNSSLRSTYKSGNKKLSFKLDFDEFEDDYPAIKNQRFYGFKQLNLNNNFDDASLMRDKIGADIFRQFGLVSAKSAFCVIYIDNGTGPQYYGVYALVEEVDDTVLDSQFTNGSGNLYKPEGNAATFANGTYNTNQFDLKTNEDSADYSDVKALYDIINSPERMSDIEGWKTNLVNIFYVDGFVKWLAANTIIQNWDTYGRMPHNYYLYNNPENNLLSWIPWDNNEAFQVGKQGGAVSLSLGEVGSNWPLIRYIIDVAEYKQMYETCLKQFIDEVFIPSKMISTYTGYYNLLKDYAYAEEPGYTFLRNDSEFDQAIENLKIHVQSRNDAVIGYLN